jgi:HEAT repeat protein
MANSRSNDLKTSDDARQALSKLDAKSIPALISILKKGHPCEQVDAAHLIVDLDSKNPDIVPVMTAVTRGASLRTLFHPQEEMMCRRAAAYVLALSADGIPVLTRLLKEGDLWERQTAIFALDDLTETTNYPDGSIPAMKELIPQIAKATKAKDRVLSEMADEVLGQISRGANTELSSLAKKYIGHP